MPGIGRLVHSLLPETGVTQVIACSFRIVLPFP
jgi:hypothetical protein